MNYRIKKYQLGSIMDSYNSTVKKERHWSEGPESWDWLKSWKPEPEKIPISVEDLIKGFEGFRSNTYLDGKGLPTIGYGTRDEKLVAKGIITEKDASKALSDFLDSDVNPYLTKKSYYSKLNPNQIKALQSLIYNIGPTQFNAGKKLQSALKDQNWEEAAYQMDWGMNDKKNTGLRTRRLAEQKLFLSNLY